MRTAEDLIADAGAPRAARELVRSVATHAGCTGQRTEQAVLLASELVTNAVVHGRTDVVRLTCDVVDGDLSVAVRDGSPTMPVVRDVAPSEPNGRGLLLVDRMADAWGVDRDGQAGKAVWFRVPCR